MKDKAETEWSMLGGLIGVILFQNWFILFSLKEYEGLILTVLALLLFVLVPTNREKKKDEK